MTDHFRTLMYDLMYLDDAGALDGIAMIAAERRRQIEELGYDALHDDKLNAFDLGKKAAVHASGALESQKGAYWSWAAAGSLAAAAIDRFTHHPVRATGPGRGVSDVPGRARGQW